MFSKEEVIFLIICQFSLDLFAEEIRKYEEDYENCIEISDNIGNFYWSF